MTWLWLVWGENWDLEIMWDDRTWGNKVSKMVRVWGTKSARWELGRRKSMRWRTFGVTCEVDSWRRPEPDRNQTIESGSLSGQAYCPPPPPAPTPTRLPVSTWSPYPPTPSIFIIMFDPVSLPVFGAVPVNSILPALHVKSTRDWCPQSYSWGSVIF